jgi:hypothetical protein
VESEVEAALEREQGQKGETVLFPIRLDGAVMKTGHAWAADIRRKRHMGDFSNWKDHNSYKKAFDRLLRDLQGATGIRECSINTWFRNTISHSAHRVGSTVYRDGGEGVFGTPQQFQFLNTFSEALSL